MILDPFQTIVNVGWRTGRPVLVVYAKATTGNNSVDPNASVSFSDPWGVVNFISGFSAPSIPIDTPPFTFNAARFERDYFFSMKQFLQTVFDPFSAAIDAVYFRPFDFGEEIDLAVDVAPVDLTSVRVSVYVSRVSWLIDSGTFDFGGNVVGLSLPIAGPSVDRNSSSGDTDTFNFHITEDGVT